MQGLAKQNYLEAERRREEFLTEIRGGLSPKEACELLGITPATYRAWRSRDSFFAAEVDSIRTGARQFKEEAPTWENFAEFRKLFFGHETPFHQAMIVNALEQTAPGDITMVLVPPEHGKGLHVETPIPTPRGWKKMGDLDVGDVIFAGDGTPTTVRFVSSRRKIACYTVTFSDGSSIICDADHLWLTRTRKPQGQMSVKGIEEIAATVRAHGRPNHGVPVGGALDRWLVIQSVEPCSPVETVCIQVDHPSRLFLAGHQMVATHNTTLFEDYASMKLATDPEYRITVGCEAQGLSRRILGRIKNRMEENGPFKKYVQQFGPFVPQNMDGNASRQTWSQDYFNVYKRRGFDERDYNMVGIGFGSNIAGSRTDHLHCDDLQSLKTIAQTEKMVETFRQDWLSRPGETGITTINGTRVADGDIYEKLEEHFSGEDFFRVVRLPAIVKDHTTGEERPLWPRDPDSPHKQKGYTMEMLDRLRKKVGEDAWSRNYMQKPRAQGLGTFTVDIVDRCLNPGRGIDDPLPDNGPIYIGLDPALGGINCLTAWQVSSKKLYLVAIQEDRGLARNEQIMDGLESMVLRMQGLGGNVTDVVIEAMNFQRGLARDERLQEMAVRYGFSLREHLTGVNKYDPDIGVPSMTSTFIKKEIDMPWKADERTRELVGEFREQHLRWKPGVKGNVLRQDMVMSEWFVWILWQSRRRNHLAAGTNFKGSGLPWTPTTSGLLLPAGASPFYGR